MIVEDKSKYEIATKVIKESIKNNKGTNINFPAAINPDTVILLKLNVKGKKEIFDSSTWFTAWFSAKLRIQDTDLDLMFKYTKIGLLYDKTINKLIIGPTREDIRLLGFTGYIPVAKEDT